jgi:Mycobacterium membrane protein
MFVYMDVNGHPHRVELTTLPWSHTETTTLTVVSSSVSAQVHGEEIGRPMLVNGVVRAGQSATHQDAHVLCIVKSA